MKTLDIPKTIKLNIPGKGKKQIEPTAEIILPDPADNDQPGFIEHVSRCDFSIPIIFDRNEENVRVVRLRTRLDDIVAQRKKTGVPTNRAIKMANAMLLEEYLTTGEYGSTSQFAQQIGVSHTHLNRLLNMLNLPPDEIERILFETH